MTANHAKVLALMKSSLIPEKPLLVYPSLAATVGLDEAIMLSALADISSHLSSTANNGYHWFSIERDQLQELLPFWDIRDLQRVVTNLREKGIILVGSAPLTNETHFKFAFNEGKTQNMPRASTTPAPTAPTPTAPRGKNYIASNWQPDEATLSQLAQLNIPTDFAQRQIPEFVTYWRERNEPQRSWQQKFISWTIPRWRKFEEQEHRKQKAAPIPSNWQPQPQTVDDLEQRNIPRQFVLDAVREFISYWQATGEQHISWESKFIQRVMALWADSENKRNVSKEAMSISRHWRPSADAIEVMTVTSGIPMSFVEDSIPEFIIYWQDKGHQTNTWNSLFIKHIRLQWHRFQHAETQMSEACVIPQNWQPSKDVFDILGLANIDASFARELIPEFILYWRDRNELQRSWNSKFLQHVKRVWAQRHHHTATQTDNTNRSTRDISLEEELNDTSWAS